MTGTGRGRCRTMATFISHSPAETECLGEAWGREAEQGLVVGLTGDLGAGKTQLVKGIARGLGITARVHSPTFALVNHYAGGRLELFHLDLYRLDTPEQVLAAGLGEYLEPEGVTAIEWAEKLWGAEVGAAGSGGPNSALRSPHSNWRWVRIETLSETERRIAYEDFSG